MTRLAFALMAMTLPAFAAPQLSVDPSGLYRVSDGSWSFEGQLPSAVEQPLTATGQDRLGPYQELSFQFKDPAGPMAGTMRAYPERGVVFFQQSALAALTHPPQPFPDFKRLPQGLHPFSYGQEVFARPYFSLKEGSNAWLLFDTKARSLVFSPAEHFMTASLRGDGKTRLACGFNDGIGALPEGFSQTALLALGSGINVTWEAWGQAMTDLQGKVRPANDADVVLKRYGYWTDAGASYWYNYDTDKGYAGTLKAIADSYKAEGIPLGYMQLDSWWYHKTLMSPAGQKGGSRNDKLPEGDWNRYGGTMEYRAHPFVFPEGMRAFTDAVGLPIINHNRWIDPSSPYHQRYAISGLAAVDPAFWDEIAGYLQASGSIGYEQDWLSEIYFHSPELGRQPGMDDAFLGNMAEAFARRGMSLQYCMGMPSHYLYGSKLKALTHVRCSPDRFQPSQYRWFLYTGRLASALGLWPWSDVFMSHEQDNLLMSVLSAGPVGTGDLLGQEDRVTLMRAMRPDGVLVKPDASLVPTDGSYLAEAKGETRPLVASTFTEHGNLRTTYAVAFQPLTPFAESLKVTGAELGCHGPVYAYDLLSGTGAVMKSGQDLRFNFHSGALAALALAPISKPGIALLGDAGRFVGTGKKRIAALKEEGGKLKAQVLFAPGEELLILQGYAAKAPQAAAAGHAVPVDYDSATGRFKLGLGVKGATPGVDTGGDPVKSLDVEIWD
jgi:hypothetical protein